MTEESIFAGIDIGSTAVRIAVGQRSYSGEKEQVHIIGAAESPSEGVHRGVINSIEDAVSSVSSCIEKVERMVGVQLGHVWVSLSGTNATSMQTKGVVAVSRPDGEIREEDVARAVDQAQAVAMPVNYEIVHVIPRMFSVDGQNNIKDPVGMNGIRLEVDAQIIQGLSSHVKNLTKCIYRTGLNIEHLVLGILAAAEVVTTPRQRELGVCVVNIGGASTSLIVYEQGDILHMSTIPIGSDHITADVAIGLRTTIEIAEQVKLNHAVARAKEVNRSEKINLRDLGATEDDFISAKFVADIVQPRIEEVLFYVDKELKRIGRSGMLPAGVVFTGGGAKLPGLVELAKERLRLPASLGYPFNVTSITDRVTDLGFTTAIGLVQYGIHEAPETHSKKRGQAGFGQAKPVDKAVSKIKKWIGSLVS